MIAGAVIARLLDETAAAGVRAGMAAAGYVRYGLVDRGSYETCARIEAREVIEQVRRVAEQATDRRLRVEDVRGLRLRAGDYLLAHHDGAFEGVEGVIDVSARVVPGAEVHWRRNGKVFLRMPGVVGTAAIVERGLAVQAHHTYVSRRYEDAEIVRIVVRMREG